MSPLKIMMLLRLHVRANPFVDMPLEQVNAPAMEEAFEYFEANGLLAAGVNWFTVSLGRVSHPFLSSKGLQLVDRLREVQP